MTDNLPDRRVTPISDAIDRIDHEGLDVEVKANEQDAAVLAGGRVDFGKDDQFTVGGSGGWIRSKGWQIAAYFGWTPKGKAK